MFVLRARRRVAIITLVIIIFLFYVIRLLTWIAYWNVVGCGGRGHVVLSILSGSKGSTHVDLRLLLDNIVTN
jgi:hypothetical protein